MEVVHADDITFRFFIHRSPLVALPQRCSHKDRLSKLLHKQSFNCRQK